ncbi:uncharacterized protein [Watersipora subatra]|uniref:uncharacterized protein n=1 Tax=Watersipora subatra TaxID=2589382 RepID=UPI00355BC212
MQYSYKDLHQMCQMEAITGHINGTIRLAQLAANFTTVLSGIYEKFGKELKALSLTFQEKTGNELLSRPKDRTMFEKSSLLVCWEKFLEEIAWDGKGYQQLASQMKEQSAFKLASCVEYKKRQVLEMCSFRENLEEMIDSSAATLHKRYEHYRDYYSDAKRREKDKVYQRCVSAHNEYIVQLTSYNKLHKEHHSKSVPQALQELESIEIEAMIALADCLQAVAILCSDKSQSRGERYDSVTSVCKTVSPSSDVSRYVKSLSPSENNYLNSLHSFTPALDHPQTPEGLLRCRVIEEAHNKVDLNQRRQALNQLISENEATLAHKELQLKGLAHTEARLQVSSHSTKLYELQLEACRRRNELNMLWLKNAINKCQMSALSYTSDDKGAEISEESETKSRDRPNAGGRSIKAMWKRFAFKASKVKSGDSSLPASSDYSTQNTSSESQQHDALCTDTAERRNSSEPDPVYALLRCAAAIRKNSSMEEGSAAGNTKHRQNHINSFVSNSSDSSSPLTELSPPCVYQYATLPTNQAALITNPCLVTSCPCKHPDVLQDYCKQHLISFKNRKRRNKNK